MFWQNRKTRRGLVLALAVLLVVGLVAALKYAQVATLIAAGAAQEAAGPPPEFVAAVRAKSDLWERTITSVGTITGEKGVQLSNDAAGKVVRIRFDSGDVVQRGEVLVELDASVERAQLAAARARRDLAQVTAARTRELVERQALAPAQLDNDQAQLEATAEDVDALEAMIERKIIRAPFDGKLGIRSVDIGQYLNPGTPVTVLQSETGIFVDFSVPQQRYETLAVGMPVRVGDGAGVTPVEGVLSAVEPRVDDATRSVKLRASVPNPTGLLQPGMFVQVSVLMPGRDRVVTVPATAIVHASYGDSVFIVEDKPPGSPGLDVTPDGRPVKIARQQFVRLGEARGDFVSVLDGVKAGQLVVTAGAFKLRNGAPIVLGDTAQPRPELNPRPENR